MGGEAALGSLDPVMSPSGHFTSRCSPRNGDAAPCLHRARSITRPGFTLIEMLVVVAIISVLAAILLPTLSNVRQRAKFTSCLNNHRQIGLGLQQYINTDKKGLMPPWITLLLSTPSPKTPFIDNPGVFICPNDPSEGREGGRPNDLRDKSSGVPISQFPNADRDNIDGGTNEDDGGINCSYLFEFNSEECDWFPSEPQDMDDVENSVWNPIKEGPTLAQQYVTWYEAKMVHVKGSKRLDPPEPAYHGYVPVTRCFWHVEWPDLDHQDQILNLNYGWAVVVNQPWWERDYNPDLPP